MPGARLTVEVIGLDSVQQSLRGLVAAGHDLTPVMREIGEHLLNSTRDRFRDEQDPTGAPWAPLSGTTIAKKRRNRGRILTESGILGGTLAVRAGATSVEVGSPSIYAGTHQFGAKKGSFGSTTKGHPIPWGDIPAREFLGLSDADRVEITDIVSEYLAEQL